ncbi:membrane protein [Candidatus Magnetoovum chiemensis]|nr:membrane protein [Candidatus Magnetoovum chiemensis]
MVYVQHLAIPQHSIRRTGSHRTMTSNVIDDVFSRSVVRKALFALHVLFNFAAMWFIFRSDLAMRHIYLDTKITSDINLTTYVELGVAGALSFWSLCWHSKTLKKRFGSDDTILLSSFILFFTATVAVKAMECYTIDPVILISMPFEPSIALLPYQFFWQIALIFLKARYEKADPDKVKKDVIVSYRLMFFLYLCYLAVRALSLIDKSMISDKSYDVMFIVTVMLFVTVPLVFMFYLIVNIKSLSANSDLAVGLFSFEKTDSDKVFTKASFAKFFFYLCSLASFVVLCMFLLTIFIAFFSSIAFGVIVGALTVLYYLIATFKGLCVKSNLAAWVFVIMVIVIGLAAHVFIVFLWLVPIFGVTAYLLFFVIVFFLLMKRIVPSCI